MKSSNLILLKNNGINVPNFTVVESSGKADLSFSRKDSFAVRSSFSLEDSDSLSFAGMFSTYLDVSRNSVEDTVRKVFQDYRDKKIITYGIKHSYPEKEIRSFIDKSTVIVQEMIDPDYSGVIFTANPLGLLNETVIIVGNGIGSNVVEEKTNVTTYYYNLTDKKYYFNRMENSPELAPSVIEELIAVSSKIRGIFKQESDIEFAIKDDIVYILQSRRITSIDSSARKLILDNSNIVESYPGLVLPLTEDFVKKIYRDIFERLIKRISHSKKLVRSIDSDMVEFVNGRAYYTISDWYTVLSLMPFSSKIIPVWQKMLGVDNKYISKRKIRTNGLIKFNIALSLLYYFIMTPVKMKALNRRFSDNVKRYRKLVESTGATADLIKLYRNMQKEIIDYWDLTLINDLYAFVFTHLAGKHADRISEIKELSSMEPLILLSRLKDAYENKGLESSNYKELKKEYIDKYGDRCMQELKLETETYRTDPEMLDRYIADNEITVKERLSSDKFEPNLFVRHAKLGILNRESSRLNRTVIYGLARSIFNKIGDNLYRNDQIESPKDIYYLHLDELNDRKNFKETVNERKMVFSGFKRIPAFSRYIFSGKAFNKTDLSGIEKGAAGRKSKLTGDVVSRPCSKIKGEALVMTSSDSSLNHENKIIVTKMTDPGWVFILQNAKAVIAEKGSFLSHTAIISRELKKPSIVNVKDACSYIKSGDIVEMDLDTSIIRILSEGNTD